MRLLPAILVAVLLPADGAGGDVGRAPGAAAGREVVVFVMDDFSGVKSHGSEVADIVKKSCYDACQIKTVDVRAGQDRKAYYQGLIAVRDYAKNHPGARVLVNLSFGGHRAELIEAALIGSLSKAGVVVVAAAGNDGSRDRFYPAAYPDVVAVAAADGKRKKPYSNFGPHVALCASGHLRADLQLTREKKGQFIEEKITSIIEAGTSFAAPRVTGLIGYLLVERPDLSPQQAVALVRQTAEPMPREPRFVEGSLGAGQISEYGLLARAVPSFQGAATAYRIAWGALGALFLLLLLVRRDDRVEVVFVGLLTGGAFLVAAWPVLENYGEHEGRLVMLGVMGVGTALMLAGWYWLTHAPPAAEPVPDPLHVPAGRSLPFPRPRAAPLPGTFVFPAAEPLSPEPFLAARHGALLRVLRGVHGLPPLSPEDRRGLRGRLEELGVPPEAIDDLLGGPEDPNLT